ncbi:DUF1732 domain-containing protein, partial [Rhodobacterales bacterium HKCCE3408]|nr:DUF1732 domain-containing protein [Rhodobacterales bacterium HKCCE3408]
AAVAAGARVRAAFEAAGLPVQPVDPVAVLALPGLLGGAEDSALPEAALLADFDAALAGFVDMRAAEGRALAAVVTAQVDEIESLTARAAERAGPRGEAAAERFRAGVAKLLEAAGGSVDENRLSQDLAALAMKGDVAEELDRLTAHVAAARALLAEKGPIGRKLDFLTQEFNREANTLCSKSQDTELTRAGLDLKVVIDQMREQVQNLE